MMFGQKIQLTWQCRKDDLGVFISTIYQICQPIQSHALCHGWHSLTCQHALANMARRFNFANSMDIGEGKKCQQSNVTMCRPILFHPNQPHPNLLFRERYHIAIATQTKHSYLRMEQRLFGNLHLRTSTEDYPGDILCLEISIAEIARATVLQATS